MGVDVEGVGRLALSLDKLRVEAGESGEGVWARGSVVNLFHREASFPDGVFVPYQVLLADQSKHQGKLNAVWSPADTDDCIRSGLRFKVGEAVECCIGTADDGTPEWARGVVVAHFHVEPSWPEGQWAPYQVRIDGVQVPDGKPDESALKLMSSGELIWAPVDEDACIRAVRHWPQ